MSHRFSRAGLAAALLLAAGAAHANVVINQGFETGIGDLGLSGATVNRVASGGGTLGVSSASGNYHAEISNIPNDYCCGYGDSAFSYFGFASTPAYPGPYYQSVAVYIDANWAVASPNGNGQAFWIDMSGGHPSGNYGAEHNFRITPTGTNGVQVSVDGQTSPITTITTSGWYTFKETFAKGANPTDLVDTDMDVLNASDSLIGTTSVVADSPGGPLLSSQLLGPDYVWFTVWDSTVWPVQTLAIDDVQTGFAPEPASLSVLGLGVLALVSTRFRRRTV